MPYRANLGGAFGGGAGPGASHPIDIGGAIDALTNGASTLIQNAYVRNQAKAAQAAVAQQQQVEQQRYDDTVTREKGRDEFARSESAAKRERETIQDAFAREKFDTETAQKRLDSDRSFVEKGGKLGSTTISRQPDRPPSPIANAYDAAGLSAGEPDLQSALTQPVALHTMPQFTVESTPESYTAKPEAQQHVVDQMTGEVTFFDPKNPPPGLRVHPIPRADPNATGGAKMTQQMIRLSGMYDADPIIKDSKDVAMGIAKVRAAAADPTAAGDMALLYGFNKILDPGSVVRESEFAAAAQSGSLPQRIQAAALRVANGERLTPAQRADFLKQADKGAKSQQKLVLETMKRHAERATRMGMDPRDVVYDPFDETLGAPGAAQPARGPAPAGNVNLGAPAAIDPVMAKYDLTPRAP